MDKHQYYVYMLASKRNGTLYVGVTNDLMRRVWEHKNGYVKGFTHDYNVRRLVWFELHQDIHEAIAREKRIKRWRRKWKLAQIEDENPAWRDLYEDMIAASSPIKKPLCALRRTPLISPHREGAPR